MTHHQVSQEILSHLGGRGRLTAMIGLVHAIPAEQNGRSGLSVRFRARARRRINAILVWLDPTDTYTVEFWSILACEPKIVSTYREVYSDGLRDLVESETGLALSLGPVTLKPPDDYVTILEVRR